VKDIVDGGTALKHNRKGRAMKVLNKWLKMLNMQKIFGRRKKNRGILWASIIGIGVGAAAFGAKKGNGNTMKKPIQNIMNTINKKSKNIQMPNFAMAELSKELTQGDKELMKDLNLDKLEK
jgi:hypothetical protein